MNKIYGVEVTKCYLKQGFAFRRCDFEVTNCDLKKRWFALLSVRIYGTWGCHACIAAEICNGDYGVPHRKISTADIATFNAQYPKLSVLYTTAFHDRFLIVDDKELYFIGASLKDLGSKCFTFTTLAPGDIRRVKTLAFSSSVT